MRALLKYPLKSMSGARTHTHMHTPPYPLQVNGEASLSMGILQVRILEWVALPSSRGFSQPRDQTQISHTAGGFFTI